jgi:hypothetical protein
MKLNRFQHIVQLELAYTNPPPHSVKYFAASELVEQVKDRTWLAKVSNTLNQHWQKKNAAKKICPVNSLQNGHVTANGVSKSDRDNSSTANLRCF